MGQICGQAGHGQNDYAVGANQRIVRPVKQEAAAPEDEPGARRAEDDDNQVEDSMQTISERVQVGIEQSIDNA